MTNLTNQELRQRLCAIGYDVPVDFNRKYLLKFLAKKEKERGIVRVTPRRIDTNVSTGADGGSGDFKRNEVEIEVKVMESSPKDTSRESYISASTPVAPAVCAEPSHSHQTYKNGGGSKASAETRGGDSISKNLSNGDNKRVAEIRCNIPVQPAACAEPLHSPQRTKSYYSKTPAETRDDDLVFKSYSRPNRNEIEASLNYSHISEQSNRSYVDNSCSSEGSSKLTGPRRRTQVQHAYGSIPADSSNNRYAPSAPKVKSTSVYSTGSCCTENDFGYAKPAFVGMHRSADFGMTETTGRSPKIDTSGPDYATKDLDATKPSNGSMGWGVLGIALIVLVAVVWKKDFDFPILLKGFLYGFKMITGLVGYVVFGWIKLFNFQGIFRSILYAIKLVVWLATFMFSFYLAWRVILVYRDSKKQEEKELYELVEKVVELLREQHQSSMKSGGNVSSFLAINHIRDELMGPQDRISKAFLWNKLVQYISNHESRVMEEVRHISGVEFKTWRWLKASNTSKIR